MIAAAVMLDHFDVKFKNESNEDLVACDYNDSGVEALYDFSFSNGDIASVSSGSQTKGEARKLLQANHVEAVNQFEATVRESLLLEDVEVSSCIASMKVNCDDMVRRYKLLSQCKCWGVGDMEKLKQETKEAETNLLNDEKWLKAIKINWTGKSDEELKGLIEQRILKALVKPSKGSHRSDDDKKYIALVLGGKIPGAKLELRTTKHKKDDVFARNYYKASEQLLSQREQASPNSNLGEAERPILSREPTRSFKKNTTSLASVSQKSANERTDTPPSSLNEPIDENANEPLKHYEPGCKYPFDCL